MDNILGIFTAGENLRFFLQPVRISPSHPNFFSFANPSSSLLCNEPVTNLSGTPAFISFQWRTLFKVKGNFSREFTIQILQIVTQLRKFGKEKILKFDVTVQWRDYSTQLFNWSIILFSLGQFSLILVLSIKFSLVNVFFHSIKTAKSYLVDGGTKKGFEVFVDVVQIFTCKIYLVLSVVQCKFTSHKMLSTCLFSL